MITAISVQSATCEEPSQSCARNPRWTLRNPVLTIPSSCSTRLMTTPTTGIEIT